MKRSEYSVVMGSCEGRESNTHACTHITCYKTNMCMHGHIHTNTHTHTNSCTHTQTYTHRHTHTHTPHTHEFCYPATKATAKSQIFQDLILIPGVISKLSENLGQKLGNTKSSYSIMCAVMAVPIVTKPSRYKKICHTQQDWV